MRRRTHPPSHISLELLAVATHCSAPSSPVVVGLGRAREASSFLAEDVLSGRGSRQMAKITS